MTTPRLFEHVPLVDINDLADPTEGPYIVLTKKGYMVHRRFHFGRVLVPLAESPTLPEGTPALWAEIPKLPNALIGQALSFFTAIYDKNHSEAMVDLTWHPEHGYRLFVPPQTAHGGGVKALRNPEHYVGQIVGTMHSHCNFSAFHSHTDTGDADKHDGLHITIGDVKKDKPSIAIMISVAGIRWNLDLEDITDGELVPTKHPTWWERYVLDPPKQQTNQSAPPTQPQSRGYGATHASNVVAIGRTTQGNAKPGFGKGEALSIDHLLFRYGNSFDADEKNLLDTLDKTMDWMKEQLEELGIDLDTVFTVAGPAPSATDDKDTPPVTDDDDVIFGGPYT
jgi:hypothetical protein